MFCKSTSTAPGASSFDASSGITAVVKSQPLATAAVRTRSPGPDFPESLRSVDRESVPVQVSGAAAGLRNNSETWTKTMPIQAWSRTDDQCLWSKLGHLPRTASGNLQTNAGVHQLIAILSSRYGRTNGAIVSRLKHLHDPSHSAYQRLHASGSSPAASSRQLPAWMSPPLQTSSAPSGGRIVQTSHCQANPELREALKEKRLLSMNSRPSH